MTIGSDKSHLVTEAGKGPKNSGTIAELNYRIMMCLLALIVATIAFTAIYARWYWTGGILCIVSLLLGWIAFRGQKETIKQAGNLGSVLEDIAQL